MSYLRWDDSYQRLLNQWVLKVTTKLVAARRNADLIEVMNVVNDFELLGSVSSDNFEVNFPARDWLASKISELADHLSDRNENSVNQSIYEVLQEISEYMSFNEINSSAMASAGNPRILKIPTPKKARVLFDFL